MPRNILLVEPRYPTKFPPLGLMKISTYHKMLGDRLRFVKGFDSELPYEYWDRVYISTLFTYHWKITVDDILLYKNMLHGDTSRLFVGGIMATLMADDLWKATGVRPIKGLLSDPGALGDNNDINIDHLIPDYELFANSEVRYTLLDSYFGYTTRGCVWKCKFCGVPRLEPRFIDYRGLKPYVEEIRNRYGEKQHLVLFDNNILASKKFTQIITDILDLGFHKGAKFRNKLRFVDFNQGTDARLLREWHFRQLAKIAMHPLRIAFDHIGLRKIYSEKIRLAAKYGVDQLSNYILYNFNDTPEDLWTRLRLNIDLNKKYDLKIYSFPMKYIPVTHKDRSFIDEPRWNWHFLRGVQRILNVTKGIVMTGEEFFNRAFGETPQHFITILHMPENILMHRGWTPGTAEKDWLNKYHALTTGEKRDLLTILCQNRTGHRLKAAVGKTKNARLASILEYYLPAEKRDSNLTLFNGQIREGTL
jgi:hypothetical protein